MQMRLIDVLSALPAHQDYVLLWRLEYVKDNEQKETTLFILDTREAECDQVKLAEEIYSPFYVSKMEIDVDYNANTALVISLAPPVDGENFIF